MTSARLSLSPHPHEGGMATRAPTHSLSHPPRRRPGTRGRTLFSTPTGRRRHRQQRYSLSPTPGGGGRARSPALQPTPHGGGELADAISLTPNTEGGGTRASSLSHNPHGGGGHRATATLSTPPPRRAANTARAYALPTRRTADRATLILYHHHGHEKANLSPQASATARTTRRDLSPLTTPPLERQAPSEPIFQHHTRSGRPSTQLISPQPPAADWVKHRDLISPPPGRRPRESYLSPRPQVGGGQSRSEIHLSTPTPGG